MEKTDISKQTVLVLLVLTLVVSIVGTWTVLSMPTTVYKTIEIGGSPAGQVHLTVGSVPSVTGPSGESGKVAINILK